MKRLSIVFLIMCGVIIAQDVLIETNGNKVIGKCISYEGNNVEFIIVNDGKEELIIYDWLNVEEIHLANGTIIYDKDEFIDRAGFGFSFSPWPTILNEKNSNGFTITFPARFKKIFFIEPEIAYSYYENNFPNESIRFFSNSRVLFGTFLKYNFNSKVNIYIGPRIGFYNEIIDHIDNDDNSYSESLESLIVAPTLGFEYNIAENFSIGFEVNYVGLNSDYNKNTFHFIASRLSLRYYSNF